MSTQRTEIKQFPRTQYQRTTHHPEPLSIILCPCSPPTSTRPRTRTPPVESFNGTSLRLSKLERKQMGAYLCIASNDVPPAVSKRVSLSVHCEYTTYLRTSADIMASRPIMMIHPHVVLCSLLCRRSVRSFTVAPSVQVPSQLLGAPLGSEVQLQCLVEASPAPVFYWLKGGKSPTNLEAGQPKTEMLLDG